MDGATHGLIRIVGMIMMGIGIYKIANADGGLLIASIGMGLTFH